MKVLSSVLSVLPGIRLTSSCFECANSHHKRASAKVNIHEGYRVVKRVTLASLLAMGLFVGAPTGAIAGNITYTANGNLNSVTGLVVDGNAYDFTLVRGESWAQLSSGGETVFTQSFAADSIKALYSLVTSIPYNPNSVGNTTDHREFFIAPVHADNTYVQGSYIITAGTQGHYNYTEVIYPTDYSGAVSVTNTAYEDNHYAYLQITPSAAAAAVPEPSTAMLAGLGVIAIAIRAYRSRRKAVATTA